jgi:UPF0755 protein
MSHFQHDDPDHPDSHIDDVDDDVGDVGDDDDEWVEISSAPGGGRRVLVVLAAIAVALLVVAGVGAVWFQRQVDPPGKPGAAIGIDIPEGTSTQAIGDLLASKDVIASTFVWKNWFVRVKKVGPFEAGHYELQKHSSMRDVIDLLEKGPALPPFQRVTVPEGFIVPEIVARLADPKKGIAGFEVATLQALIDGGKIRSKYQPAGQKSLEGLLFPDTYRVEQGEDERAVLSRMIGQLDDTLDALHVETAQQRFNLTPYEIVVVASLIEEETKVDDERGKVAQVIYNRLRQGIPLGIDATSRYEAILAGRSRNDIDFTSTSPYNTRKIAGLPPTPIAAPGRASLEAALNPVDGPWIYYVLQDAAGHHFFTESSSEFSRAKAECKAKGLGCG